jgi:hypothetical protein
MQQLTLQGKTGCRSDSQCLQQSKCKTKPTCIPFTSRFAASAASAQSPSEKLTAVEATARPCQSDSKTWAGGPQKTDRKDSDNHFSCLGLKRKPDVLAPAGGWPQLRAAVENGADAVYFGLSSFNARARANNFIPEELEEVPVCTLL